ncbi:hypothetical protein OH77DRAFT_1427476 [Trametes cingulata]|nr:hypothetical protein OH77DRAFT_1427476 [Trametes cingulata]
MCMYTIPVLHWACGHENPFAAMKARFPCEVALRLPPWAVDAIQSGCRSQDSYTFQRIPIQERCPDCVWTEYFERMEGLPYHGPSPVNNANAVSGAPRRPPFLIPLYFRRYDGQPYLAGVGYSSNVSRLENREEFTRSWVTDQARYQWDTNPAANVIWATTRGGRGPSTEYPPLGRLRTDAPNLGARATRHNAQRTIGQWGGRGPGGGNWSWNTKI